MSDNVNHPAHYTQGNRPCECIELTERYGFVAGNAIKYFWRHESKNGREDLEKALWYLRRLESRGLGIVPVSGRNDRLVEILHELVAVSSKIEREFWLAVGYADTKRAIAAVTGALALECSS